MRDQSRAEAVWLWLSKQSLKQDIMGHKKNGKPPGRTSSFTDEKLAWLVTWENDFRTRPRGNFYDDVTKQFLTRYGYDLPFEDNVPGEIDAWSLVNRKEGLSGERLDAETNFQDEKRKELRGVGFSL
jgi:hypothetical protein